ncbi:hypothetical protein EUTSA_v10011918mg [Eutrema salsugineum]|uniref:Uncharacterized protein n=1 Tax=Eutrema salsugineum TaxID=72664 RepID=V4KL74_EUTSA|nr:hypothetical protein EUTSA_v10011918mg [Eutrema salsugineum]
MPVSLVLYLESFNPSKASFIAIGTLRQSISAIFYRISKERIKSSKSKQPDIMILPETMILYSNSIIKDKK